MAGRWPRSFFLRVQRPGAYINTHKKREIGHYRAVIKRTFHLPARVANQCAKYGSSLPLS